MRNPNADELAALAPLFQRKAEAEQDVQAAAGALLAALLPLRRACEMPIGALLNPETGEWVRVAGRGQNGEPVTVPIIQPDPPGYEPPPK